MAGIVSANQDVPVRLVPLSGHLLTIVVAQAARLQQARGATGDKYYAMKY